jgi:hypothetical protein
VGLVLRLLILVIFSVMNINGLGDDDTDLGSEPEPYEEPTEGSSEYGDYMEYVGAQRDYEEFHGEYAFGEDEDFSEDSGDEDGSELDETNSEDD